MSVETAAELALDALTIALVAVSAAAAFTIATLVLVLPASALRLALARGDEVTAAKAASVRQGLAGSRPLGFARRILAHAWSAAEIVVSCVFVLTLAAGILAIVVAGYVLGVTRPTVADEALPWILGASIAVAMAYAWANGRRSPGWPPPSSSAASSASSRSRS